MQQVQPCPRSITSATWWPSYSRVVLRSTKPLLCYYPAVLHYKEWWLNLERVQNQNYRSMLDHVLPTSYQVFERCDNVVNTLPHVLQRCPTKQWQSNIYFDWDILLMKYHSNATFGLSCAVGNATILSNIDAIYQPIISVYIAFVWDYTRQHINIQEWYPRVATQWRHNGHDGVSNHEPHGRFLNRLFKAQIKETPKLHVTGLCAWNSAVTGEFPAQRDSYAEDVTMWWRYHGVFRHGNHLVTSLVVFRNTTCTMQYNPRNMDTV